VCAKVDYCIQSPGLRDSAGLARLDLESADFEGAQSDTDPAPRMMPDGVAEVRCIPSSLRQPDPREHSCEKSCRESKLFAEHRNVHANGVALEYARAL
jgi:hypothetical protein